MSKEVKFAQGIRVFSPNGNAPSFVKGQLLINKRELGDWLHSQEDEIRIDILESKKGGWYTAVSSYKPKSQPEDTGIDKLPF